MKEIPINDGVYMVINDNAISFYYKTSLSEKIAFIFVSVLTMFLMSGFLLVTSICFREFWKSPNLLLIAVFCVFGAGSILLAFILYHFFMSIFSYYSRIEIDNGVISYYFKRILSYSRILVTEDYVIINFTYNRGSYGIGIRLKWKRGLGHFFLWRTILNSGFLAGQWASYKMSRKIEDQIKEVFPTLSVVNQCRERSSWSKGDM